MERPGGTLRVGMKHTVTALENRFSGLLCKLCASEQTLVCSDSVSLLTE